MAGRNEKKNITKSKIVNYIINNKITSKADLAQNLSLSMPTVLSNVNELIDRNMVIEIGEYESTGASSNAIQYSGCIPRLSHAF